jgi:hypothetical protein
MKRLFVSILFVLIASVSYAEDFYEVDSSSDGSGLYIDMESVIRGLRGIATANIYEYYPNKPASKGKLKADTIIDKYEFRCNTKEARQVSELYYYKDKLVGTEKSNDVWHKVVKDTGIIILREVCAVRHE